MTSPKNPPGQSASDRDVQALLQRHRCPTPLHELRALLLGNIASPSDISPMSSVIQAWGGELPEFATAQDVEELMQMLVHGLWNRLSEHQNTRSPFRLPRFEVASTRQALLDLAHMRAQELRGFADGLFGDQDELQLPQKAHEAMVALAELHAMFDGAAALLADESKSAPPQELKALLRNLQQMTIVADEQINRAIQSCKRARGQRLESKASVMSRKFPSAHLDQRDAAQRSGGGDHAEPEIIKSPLSQRLTRNGATVPIEIYGDFDGAWILEVVDAENTSHVWEEPFATDQLALAEALRALDEEPLEFFGRATGRALN